MNNLYYKEKYFKYKAKYLKLLSYVGGALPKLGFTDKETNTEKYTTNSITKFIDLVKNYDSNGLNMVIGLDLKRENSIDLQRNFNFDVDVGVSDLLTNIDDLPVDNIKWFQISCDMNSQELFSGMKLTQLLMPINKISFTKTCKFKKIVFDRATSNFLKNSGFIAFLYYALLEVGGEIYIDYYENTQNLVNNDKFYYNTNNYIFNNKNTLDGTSFITMFKTINTIEDGPQFDYTYDEIMQNNRLYFEKFLLESTVTVHNDGNYPIIHPIAKFNTNHYIKIVKNNIKKITPQDTVKFRSYHPHILKKL